MLFAVTISSVGATVTNPIGPFPEYTFICSEKMQSSRNLMSPAKMARRNRAYYSTVFA